MTNVTVVEQNYDVTVTDNVISIVSLGVQGPPGPTGPIGPGGGTGIWGGITGTLSDQTDLQGELDGKSDTTHNHTGVYEPADATILKDVDIGITIAAESHTHTLDGLSDVVITQGSPIVDNDILSFDKTSGNWINITNPVRNWIDANSGTDFTTAPISASQGIAIGDNTNASAQAVAIGTNTTASANYTYAIGLNTSATSAGAISVGTSITNNITNSFRAGFSTINAIHLKDSGRLHLEGAQAAFVLPSYASGSEPTALEGCLIWDTTINKPSVYNGTDWVDLGTAGSALNNIVEDTTPQLGGNLDCNGNSVTSLVAPMIENAQIGTAYTAVLTDAEIMITLDNASPIAMTIPANASVAYPVGTKLNFMQVGAGAVTIGITSDTLNVDATYTKVLAGQWSVATAWKRSATVWVLFGGLVPA